MERRDGAEGRSSGTVQQSLQDRAGRGRDGQSRRRGAKPFSPWFYQLLRTLPGWVASPLLPGLSALS